MFKRRLKIPAYRLHKNSGQAVVTLGGRDFYLGPHGTKTSKNEYDRLVGEWLANGRQLPPSLYGQGLGPALSVKQVAAGFWVHAQAYYQKDGRPTSEVTCIGTALRSLLNLYALTPAADFGPLAFKAIRQTLIDQHLARKTINSQMERIRRMFKWAAENEFVPASVYHGLIAVSGLRVGRSEARETAPVKPADLELVKAVRPFVSAEVWAMIELQRLTGMRPGEVVTMTAAAVERSSEGWTYCPTSHKTAHHGHERIIPLGPQAVAVLAPFVDRHPEGLLFRPEEAEAERHAAQARRAEEKQARHGRGRKRKKPRRRRCRPPGEFYTIDSYRRAIARACERAFPPPKELLKISDAAEREQKLYEWRRAHSWHPHQLRHYFGTMIRREYGLEAAQVLLGHRHARITEVYAEPHLKRAREIAARIG